MTAYRAETETNNRGCKGGELWHVNMYGETTAFMHYDRAALIHKVLDHFETRSQLKRR
jgi:hypothetical protein